MCDIIQEQGVKSEATGKHNNHWKQVNIYGNQKSENCVSCFTPVKYSKDNVPVRTHNVRFLCREGFL